MGLFEKKDLRDYIATWSTQLSPDYKAAWNEWLKKRDIVAKQMGLDEKQILYVTKIDKQFVCLFYKILQINYFNIPNPLQSLQYH